MQLAVAPYRLHAGPPVGFAGLSGEQPIGCFDVLGQPHVWSSSSGCVQCGYYGCGPNTGSNVGLSVPAYYSTGLAVAQQQHYSVPVNAADALNGAAVECVNPDGTVTRIFQWANYPPGPGGNAVDPSFIPPPSNVWFNYMAQLGTMSIATAQAAAVAAAMAYANAVSPTSNPGLNPAKYVPPPIQTGGGGGGTAPPPTGGGGGGSSPPGPGQTRPLGTGASGSSFDLGSFLSTTTGKVAAGVAGLFAVMLLMGRH